MSTANDWTLTYSKVLAIDMFNEENFTFEVEDEGMESRIRVRTSSGEYGTLLVDGPGDCEDWLAYNSRIVQAGPLPANMREKECGAVDPGNHTVTLNLSEGAGILFIEVHQRGL